MLTNCSKIRNLESCRDKTVLYHYFEVSFVRRIIWGACKPRSNVLNILTEQHWTFVQQSWVLFSDVQLLGGQTYWTFCWARLNFALTFTHRARANWTNIQWLFKGTEQHSTFRKTKEMLSRSTFVPWKVWSRSSFTEQDSTRVNKAQQGGQTLWTFCTQQMVSVVQSSVQYVWPGPYN